MRKQFRLSLLAGATALAVVALAAAFLVGGDDEPLGDVSKNAPGAVSGGASLGVASQLLWQATWR